MPVKSLKQWKFMQMIVHNPEKAKKNGLKQKVAKEFIKATSKGLLKNLPEKKK